MSDHSEKSILVAQVVDALFGYMLSKPLKVREDAPEHVKEQMLKSQTIFRENHRKFSIELYEKYMTVEQLQELLNFHTSDIGKSIKEAQAKIQKELTQKYKELEVQKDLSKHPGSVVIRTKTYGLDEDEDS